MNSKIIMTALAEIRAKAKLLDFSDRRVILSNLIFGYQVIVASENLLKEAADVASDDLHDYYVAHLEEERGHEKWLAEDLANAGISVAEIPRIHQAVELAGSQYYLLKHVDPHALLGYMMVLECFPLEGEKMGILEKIHGESLLRTLRYHAKHDIEHREDLFSIVDRSPIGEILPNAIRTAECVNAFFEDLPNSELWKFLGGIT